MLEIQTRILCDWCRAVINGPVVRCARETPSAVVQTLNRAARCDWVVRRGEHRQFDLCPKCLTEPLPPKRHKYLCNRE